MSPFEFLLIIVSGIYTVFSIVLTIGVAKRPRVRQDYEPQVTVVVPARNEEEHIEKCLQSLETLNYPHSKLQVVVVDDHSDDATASIVQTHCGRYPFISLITLSDISGSGDGKITALAKGYTEASGEIIFQTDADCIVPEEWIRTMLSRFDDDVGIVGGMTILNEFSKKNTCFTRIQTLDWIYLLGVGAGAGIIGVPLSCFGNNLALRRAAYDAVGGYEAIPFTFTEDFAIFRAIARAGWKTGFSLEKSSLIYCRPLKTFRAFVNQRLRWATGGIKLAGAGKILLATAFLLHVVVLGALFSEISPFLWAAAVTISVSTDFVFLSLLGHKIKKIKLLWYFPLFELYYYLYTTVIGILLPFVSSLQWKGRKYSSF